MKERCVKDIKEINNMKENIPQEELLFDLADFFKMLGDSTRIKILNVLLQKELCVNDIARILEMSQSAVSHQLRVLRQTRLVKYKKDGKYTYYSLDDEHVEEVLKLGLVHISELR